MQLKGPRLSKASLRKWLIINVQPIRRMAKKGNFSVKSLVKIRLRTRDGMEPASHLESRQLWNPADEQAEGVTKQSDPFSFSVGPEGSALTTFACLLGYPRDLYKGLLCSGQPPMLGFFFHVSACRVAGPQSVQHSPTIDNPAACIPGVPS